MYERPYFPRLLPEVLPVDEEEVTAVAEALRSAPLTTLFGGHEVGRFEEEFAALFGAPHAVAVTSGTTALLAALMAAGIGPGDEVIVTPFSFIASVSVVLQVGAVPVFADVDPETLTLDPASVAERITPRTRAVILVHACGYPADVDAVMELAGPRGIVVVEDCAGAHGARLRGRAVGTIGDFGCFSFNIGKIMRTGEGGMVLTRDGRMRDRLAAVRVNGMEPAPGGARVALLGCNFTMAHPLAALGRVQVRRYPALARRRREIGETLRRAVEGTPASLPPDRPGVERAYYSLPFRLTPELAPLRDALVDEIRAHNVPAGRGNARLLHQVDYVRAAVPEARCPVAEAVHPALFHVDPLPIYTDLEAEGIGRVLRMVLARHGAAEAA
jgi:perosamine synthetase